ncbi:MAG: hypothetical protein M3Q19_00630 [Pseudomonadota bacterium]|nr:hypothetical protein [Pseudomonadota bacterium]
MTCRWRSLWALVLATSCFSPIFTLSASETVEYTYDALGRLVKVSRSGSVNNGASACYSYDEAANRSNVRVATAANCATGTSAPSFWVNDAVTTEGTSLTFLVTKAGAASSNFSINYETSNGSALSGTDYTYTSGTLTFEPGQVSKQVSVPTTYTSTHEGAETLSFTLSAPTGGATISDTSGMGTINDNGVPPSFAISDALATEGSSLVLIVTKTGTTSVSFDINYATANNTAVVESDYTATSGTLTFGSSDTTKSITVATINDETGEGSENLHVNLSGATGGATITDAQGAATINDDDLPPSFSISDAYATEGVSDLIFTVTKTGGTYVTVSVNYATANGTASGASDYYTTSGTLTFGPGEYSKSVTVTTRNNSITEPPETMYVNLSSATGGAVIADAQGAGEIEDDDNMFAAPPPEEPEINE